MCNIVRLTKKIGGNSSVKVIGYTPFILISIYVTDIRMVLSKTGKKDNYRSGCS